MELTFKAVDANHWRDFERLFEGRGGPKSCWCMLWRANSVEVKHTDGASRKAAISARVHTGTPIGLLAYLGSDPVAWCSIAPRASYRRLVSNGSSDDGVWSIACFYVVRRLRGESLCKQVLAAAVRHARENGAKVVEAYPVEPDSPSYRFMGFVPMFEEAGFREVGREGTRRHVVRYNVSAPEA